jgi:dihydrofolate synthase/folylpolyglutamate synthase
MSHQGLEGHHYLEACRFLESLDVSALKLGLERITRLLETLGNPQESYPTLHIAGTNGKGSTSAMLTSVLVAAGRKVGTTISPHLVEPRERIQINGRPIRAALFADAVFVLKAHLERLDWPAEEWPTYFEFLVAMAFQVFQQEGVTAAVIEVGLGGRLDGTNVLKHPTASVITHIGFDHMERLGHTLDAIAREKAGIIKPGCPLIIGPDLHPEAKRAILEVANERGAKVIEANSRPLACIGNENPLAIQKIYDSHRGIELHLPLPGLYQRQNLATVLTVVDLLRSQGWEISTPAVLVGLANTRWPARMQWLADRRILIDGSHNPDGFQSLSESLKANLAEELPLYWLLSLRKNRNPEDLLAVIRQFPATLGVLFSRPGHRPDLYHEPRTLMLRARQDLPMLWNLPVVAIEGFPIALKILQQWQTSLRAHPHLGHLEQTTCIVSGSLYTAGEALHLLCPESLGLD